jgi:HEPN domain-containing protein
MNRADFQASADERSDDAEALLRSGRYGCAYYIAGYAVECALKAIIAHQTKEGDFPPKESPRYYSHKLQELLGLAGIQSVFDKEKLKYKAFEDNWQTVKDWNEESRYQSWGQREAEEIVAAVRDADHGVLQWLKQYW